VAFLASPEHAGQKRELAASRAAAELIGVEGLYYEARNPAELSALKEKLKQTRTSAPLFDADGFRGALEEAFISMHK